MCPDSPHSKQCLHVAPSLRFLQAWHPRPRNRVIFGGPWSLYDSFRLSFGT
jgi:hypothetical protein